MKLTTGRQLDEIGRRPRDGDQAGPITGEGRHRLNQPDGIGVVRTLEMVRTSPISMISRRTR